MDNVCHSLAGAVIAEAAFARRLPRATLLAVVAANIPDADALTYLFASSSTAVAFRRGWTHGILALPLWAVTLAALFAWWARRPPRAAFAAPPGGGGGRAGAPDEAETPAWRTRDFLILAAGAVASHPVLDWMNTYGVRFLMPFSDRWSYGDTLFIVDPVLIVVFGAGWALTRTLRTSGVHWSAVPARAAIGVGIVYITAMKGMSVATRVMAAREFGMDAPTARELMVTPRPLAWFERDVLARRGDVYEWRSARWDGLHPVVAASGWTEHHGGDPETVAAVRSTPAGADFLRWARFPYFVPGTGAQAGTIFVGDARYAEGTSESWAGIRVRPARE